MSDELPLLLSVSPFARSSLSRTPTHAPNVVTCVLARGGDVLHDTSPKVVVKLSREHHVICVRYLSLPPYTDLSPSSSLLLCILLFFHFIIVHATGYYPIDDVLSFPRSLPGV